MTKETHVPGKAVSTITTDFPALKGDPAELLDVVRENLAGQTLGDRDLDIIKIPAGGGRAWEIPTLEGSQVVQTFTGVVIYHKQTRAYWKVSLDDSGGGTPPDCSSPNGLDGYGDPGNALGTTGACDVCPFAQFGSRDDGRPGQACKQMHNLYLLMGGEVFGGLLPKVVVLPPTSLKAARQFFVRLSSAGLPYWGIQIELGLEKISGKGTPDYSVATFKAGARLSDGDKDAVNTYRTAIAPLLERRMPTPAEARAAHAAA